MPEHLTLQGSAQTLVRLKQSLAQLAGPAVVLDAAPMRVFDTSAVAVLLELRNGLLSEGKSLQVLNMPERLKALVALYGVLYGILISEDNALMMGSLLLFGVLAAIMVATRKIDWYHVMGADDVPPAAGLEATRS